MSLCPHRQSNYKLRKLPRCNRCKIEMILVSAMYDNSKSISWEWECPKCNKSVPKNLLKEEQLSEQDLKLKEWCENNEKPRRISKRNT
jgi:ssDNA-binding Zn-finger/Zn-ribbon topoisomerase 1